MLMWQLYDLMSAFIPLNVKPTGLDTAYSISMVATFPTT